MTDRTEFALFVFLVLVAAAAFTGYLWPPGDWYGYLMRPAFAPPNWVFAPVWTVLYLMMAVAAWLVWRRTGWRSRPLTLWYIQLALNAVWTPVFFGLHWMGVALVVMALLWLAIILTIRAFAAVSRVAAWMLVPYLAWVTFALALNAGFWYLNREPVFPIPPSTAHLEEPADAMMDDWLTLADDAMNGRKTGTEDYERAVDYVRTRLADGIATEVALQPVEYVRSTLEDGSVTMRQWRDDHAIEFGWVEEFYLSPSVHVEATSARAPAVFIGHGIRAPEAGVDDYADVDVAGKIVVMMSGVPEAFDANQRAHHTSSRRKAQLAAEAGAVGIITIRNARQVRRDWSASMSRALRPEIDLVGPDGVPVREPAAIQAQLSLSETGADSLFANSGTGYRTLLARNDRGEPLGTVELPGELEISSRQSIERFQAPNVYGVIHGSDPALADEYVVLTAHLDGLGVGGNDPVDMIRNGAYDNALGVAMITEIGRRIAAMETRPRRSIAIVAVGGEEEGLLGSEYFASNPPFDGRVVANLNIDMALFMFPVTEIVAFGAEHTTLGALATAAAEAEGFTVAPDPFPEEVFFVRSDHYSFVREGVPALFLDAGVGSTDPNIDGNLMFRRFLKHHYHQARDDIYVPVHWPSVRRFVSVGTRITLAAANADESPAWMPDSYFGKIYAKE